ncbi:MAG: hypothetical protein L6367_07440 [Cellulomonas sp.]|nr:hypothetical protein [Cellulomonas sp.]
MSGWRREWAERFHGSVTVIAATSSAALATGPLDGETVIVAHRVDGGMLDLVRRAPAGSLRVVTLESPDSLEGLEHVSAPRIRVTGQVECDADPLHRLNPQVRELDLRDALLLPRQRLDLERLSDLRTLVLDQAQDSRGARLAPGVRSFTVRPFSGKAIADLPHGAGVRKLTVIQARGLGSLAGLGQAYPALRALGLHGLPRLVDLSPVEEVRALRWLSIESCRGLADISATAAMSRLQYLAFEDCPSLASIGPLAHHVALERFVANGSTKIADGDLSPLASVPHLRMMIIPERRGYHPSPVDVALEMGLDLWEPWDFDPEVDDD